MKVVVAMDSMKGSLSSLRQEMPYRKEYTAYFAMQR